MRIRLLMITIAIIAIVVLSTKSNDGISETCHSVNKVESYIDTTLVGIDYRLAPFVSSYIEEGNKRGVYTSSFISSMSFIGFSNKLSYPKLGFTTGDRKNILIADFCMIDTMMLKVVLYHELTHAVFGRNHTELSKNDIMRATLGDFHLYRDKEFFNKRLDELFNYREGETEVKSRNVTATVYNAVVEQCNSDPSHTASMFKLDLDNPYKHRIIAVSRDLLDDFPMGTKVKISGTEIYDGEYQVQDKMNKRYSKTIDILINKDMSIGKWENVIISKIQ